MTVSSSVRTAGPFTGNGLSVAYPFTFKIFTAADLYVVRTDTLGALTVLVLGADYTVAPNADQNAAPGGTLSLNVTLPIGYTLAFTTLLDFTQDASLTNAGGFYPKTIEDALDRCVILIQQSLTNVEGAIRVPEFTGIPALPGAAIRANQLLSFDSLGNPTVVLPVAGSATALQISLANAANGAGADLIGGVGRVVDNIAALKALAKTGVGRAFVLGYYTPGDGGGGQYYYDATDIISADNGGTIIKASDNGLWKLIVHRAVSVKQFGAMGDGVNNDKTFIQAAIQWVNPNTWAAIFNYQQGGGTLHLPKGIYRITGPLYLRPFVILEGEGCDGWTGGISGFGVTSGASPANGTAIFADFGATTATCAIDTQNYNISTGANYGAATQALLAVGAFGSTYTYCQGAGLKKIALFCTNNMNVGVRLQGGALAKLQDVSIVGFKVGLISNCCWTYEYENLFINATQIPIYLNTNNAGRISGDFDCAGWGTSSGTVITPNGNVTSGNKPGFWSTNDTNYNPTSIYVVNSTGITFPDATCQHAGRVAYIENSDVGFDMVYCEDLPFLTSGPTPGAFNTWAAAPGNASVVIRQMEFQSNGSTVFNSLVNLPVTLLAFNGIQGTMYGPTGTAQLLLGLNVNRNVAYGDTAFDARQLNLAPTSGTWTPTLTNFGGAVGSVVGEWVKNGDMYQCTVTITGTALTATGAGASVVSTPFGSTGFPAPQRASAGAVATSNLQQIGGALMDTNASLYVPAIASTTRIVISWPVWGI